MASGAAIPQSGVATLFRALASEARPAGSEQEKRARAICSEWLREAGYQVTEHPFTYSAWPGLYGTAAVGLMLLLLAAGSSLVIELDPLLADRMLGLALLGAAIVAILAAWLSRFGTQQLPWSRRVGTNLEATRGAPRVWLVAHLDSKSQPVSLLVRAAAAIGIAGAWLGILGLWTWGQPLAAQSVALSILPILLTVASVAALPLVVSGVGSRGTGALDNASGVATVLAAARMAADDGRIGVLITSAEELGLAGARAWLVGRAAGIAINCDGVDDLGGVTITAGRRRAGFLWREAAARAACGTDVRFRFILPGVLLDAVAFSDAGWTACTVSQGTLRSLGRIHTARDTVGVIGGSGIDRTAQVIVALASAITE